MKRFPVMLLSALILFNFAHSIAAAVDIRNQRIVGANAGLRLRETPDTNGKVIMTIPFKEIVTILEEKGEPVAISGKSGKWTKIKWQDKTGWAFGGFLEVFAYGDIPVEAEKELQANTIDIKELYGKQMQSKEPENGRPIEIKFNKNGTFNIMRPLYAGEFICKGKYEITSYGDPVVLSVKSSKSDCSDMGQVYACSIDNGAKITIEKTDGKFFVTSDIGIGGKWEKIEFIFSK